MSSGGPGVDAPPEARAVSSARAVNVAYPHVAMSRPAAGIDLFLIVGLFSIYQVLVGLSGLPALFEEWLPSVGIFGVNMLLGILMLGSMYVLLVIRRQGWSAIGMGHVTLGRLVLGTLVAVPLCYAAVLIAVPLFMRIIGMSVNDLLAERGDFFEIVPAMPQWLIPLFAMFIGLHEEALFRGFVLGRLRALFGSTVAAVLISTVIFGSLHAYQGMVGVVQTGMVGLVLALVAVRCRTIWPAVVAHGIFNTIGLTLIPWLQENFGEMLKQTTTTAPM